MKRLTPDQSSGQNYNPDPNSKRPKPETDFLTILCTVLSTVRDQSSQVRIFTHTLKCVCKILQASMTAIETGFLTDYEKFIQRSIMKPPRLVKPPSIENSTIVAFPLGQCTCRFVAKCILAYLTKGKKAVIVFDNIHTFRKCCVESFPQVTEFGFHADFLGIPIAFGAKDKLLRYTTWYRGQFAKAPHIDCLFLLTSFPIAKMSWKKLVEPFAKPMRFLQLTGVTGQESLGGPFIDPQNTPKTLRLCLSYQLPDHTSLRPKTEFLRIINLSRKYRCTIYTDDQTGVVDQLSDLASDFDFKSWNSKETFYFVNGLRFGKKLPRLNLNIANWIKCYFIPSDYVLFYITKPISAPYFWIDELLSKLQTSRLAGTDQVCLSIIFWNYLDIEGQIYYAYCEKKKCLPPDTKEIPDEDTYVFSQVRESTVFDYTYTTSGVRTRLVNLPEYNNLF